MVFLYNHFLTFKKIKLTDFTTEEVVHSYSNLHSDFVRCLSILPGTTNSILSGGYDSIINLFNLN